MKNPCIWFSLLLFLTDSPAAEDWTQFRGNQRDGKSASKNINSNWRKTKPGLLVKFGGAGKGYSSVCVVGEKIYTTGNSGSSQFVACFNLDKGILEWKTDIVDVIPNHAETGARSTPTYSSGKLYVVASNGRLVCLDTNHQGKIIWTLDGQKEFEGRIMSGWGYSESPLVDDGKVIFTPGGENAMVVAIKEKLDFVNGSETNKPVVLWKTRTGRIGTGVNMLSDRLNSGAGYSSMITAEIFKSKQYIQFVGGGVIGIDPDSGALLWSSSLCANKTANVCAPIAFGNKVIYSSAPRGGLGIFSVSKRAGEFQIDPKVIYKPGQLQCHHGGMILHEGHLFFGNGENRGYPTCVDVNTGELKWGGSFRGPGRGSAALVFVDGKLIFRYQNGVVALVEANTREYQFLGYFRQEVESHNKSWSHPVVVDRKLILREQDEIMVYDLR